MTVSQRLTMPKEDFERLTGLASRHGVATAAVIACGMMVLEAMEEHRDDGRFELVFTSEGTEKEPKVQRVDPWKWLAA